ncbi:MAG: hypothetical protein EOO09_22235, partial [Chitinophagaceae bacterium]
MKKQFYMLLFSGIPALLSAQVYVDPSTSAAMASHSVLINSQLNNTNETLTLLQRAQLSVAAELAIANDLQSRIYRGLTEVSSALSSLLAVK